MGSMVFGGLLLWLTAFSLSAGLGVLIRLNTEKTTGLTGNLGAFLAVLALSLLEIFQASIKIFEKEAVDMVHLILISNVLGFLSWSASNLGLQRCLDIKHPGKKG